MPPKKATAKSPKPKSTPARKAKAQVAEVTSEAGSDHDDLQAEPAKDGAGSSDDSGPETEVVATPARKGGKRKASQEEGDEVESPGAKKPKVSSVKLTETVTESGKKKHAHRNVKVEIPVSTPVTKPSGKHIVFNDDDGPAEFFTPQEAPAQELLDAQLSEAAGAGGQTGEDDEGSDSDDDAPEAVSTQTAAAQAAKSARAATRAAERQLEQQKRKRQERDARLKQQAETRKKHQAASQKKAAAAAIADAEAEAEESPEQALGGRNHLPRVSAAPTRKRLDKRALPDVLPDDFLEAASDEDEEGSEQDDEQDARRPRKPKSSTLAKQIAKAESRQPQDQRVGSTVYRVARRKEDPSLAPKLHRHSQNAKKVLLQRQRPVSRKGGFLVKKRK